MGEPGVEIGAHGARLIAVDCPYCGSTHLHGGGSSTDGPFTVEHRQADAGWRGGPRQTVA